MSQSLSQVIVHFIFSTKDRAPFLSDDIRPRIHAYLAIVCCDLNADVHRVGGVADHVHVLATLPRTISQAEFIEAIKKPSSKWVKEQDATCRTFAWQRGYGAFSVSASNLEKVAKYVTNQETHHLTRSFQDEYRGFLLRHGLRFDERYVWD